MTHKYQQHTFILLRAQRARPPPLPHREQLTPHTVSSQCQSGGDSFTMTAGHLR